MLLMPASRALSSASRGKCRRISIGSVSAAMTMNSEMPRLRVLVAAGRNDKLIRAASAMVQQDELWRLLTLVGALLELLVVCSLLHNVQNGVGQLCVRQGVRLRVHSLAHGDKSSLADHDPEAC